MKIEENKITLFKNKFELIEKQKLLPHIIQSKRQFAATIMLLLLLSFLACVSINQVGHAASFNGIYLNVEPENTEQNTQQGLARLKSLYLLISAVSVNPDKPPWFV